MHKLTLKTLLIVHSLFISTCLLMMFTNVNASEREGLVLQVSENNPKVWDMVLNIAKNAPKKYKKPLDVKVVAFGPGIKMLTMDSKVANGLEEATGEGVTFLACGTTMKKLKMKNENLYPNSGVKRVDGGVIEIMRLQTAGYHYIKP